MDSVYGYTADFVLNLVSSTIAFLLIVVILIRFSHDREYAYMIYSAVIYGLYMAVLYTVVPPGQTDLLILITITILYGLSIVIGWRICEHCINRIAMLRRFMQPIPIVITTILIGYIASLVTLSLKAIGNPIYIAMFMSFGFILGFIGRIGCRWSICSYTASH